MRFLLVSNAAPQALNKHAQGRAEGRFFGFFGRYKNIMGHISLAPTVFAVIWGKLRNLIFTGLLFVDLTPPPQPIVKVAPRNRGTQTNSQRDFSVYFHF